jgi:hypothetical protein
VMDGIAGPGVGELELEVCRGRQAGARAPQRDARRREGPERGPGVRQGRGTQTGCST